MSQHPVRQWLRLNFIAGIFVAVPIALTGIFMIWVWDKISRPLEGVFNLLLQDFLERKLDSQDKAILEWAAPLVGLLILLGCVFLLGTLTRSILGRSTLDMLESLVARVPLLGVLYSSIKQLAEAFFDASGKSTFQSAVLVQFPMPGSWVIGFVTGPPSGPLAYAMGNIDAGGAEHPGGVRPDLVMVFVPTTPLPTQGFTLLVPLSQTRKLDLTVPDAIKLVISGGIISKREGGPTPAFGVRILPPGGS